MMSSGAALGAALSRARRTQTRIALLLWPLLVTCCWAQELPTNGVHGYSLHPPYFNLAESTKITATATCGEDDTGRSLQDLYCKLVGGPVSGDPSQTIQSLLLFLLLLCGRFDSGLVMLELLLDANHFNCSQTRELNRGGQQRAPSLCSGQVIISCTASFVGLNTGHLHKDGQHFP
ncbi:hypothetical protein EPR50_G00071330 [Perca flavescens]|uniref:Laminin N-terminal domain-containing protein n=1 Tax=Perca flavescens TaxID=8167 RepID=A0A484D430_PERFV|nr:hypothetical protein EPR50_G00071330 [Perca flavescens]